MASAGVNHDPVHGNVRPGFDRSQRAFGVRPIAGFEDAIVRSMHWLASGTRA